MRKIPYQPRISENFFGRNPLPLTLPESHSLSAFLILLTGLLNFFHFLTGSYLNRSHEFGIRKVNGSNGNQLFWLLFTQAIIISFITFLLTFCLIEIFNPYLSFSLFDFTLVIERDLLLIQTIEYMAGVILLCLLLCLFTVWRMKHASIQSSIYKNKSKTPQTEDTKLSFGYPIFHLLVIHSLYSRFYICRLTRPVPHCSTH